MHGNNQSSRCGGTGRRAGLKIPCPLRTCRFDPDHRYLHIILKIPYKMLTTCIVETQTMQVVFLLCQKSLKWGSIFWLYNMTLLYLGSIIFGVDGSILIHWHNFLF